MVDKVTIPRARLSYCNVFKKGMFEGVENKKFDCTMLFSKENSEVKEKVRQLITRELISHYKSKDKIPAQFKQWVDKEKFGDSERVFLRDGDMANSEETEGMWTVKAANSMKPSTYNLDKSDVSEDDGLIYSGSYADVSISVWVQDNKYGKRINANLLGLRFRDHGEPLGGGGGRASSDDFDDLDDVDTMGDDDYDDL